jgi:3-isopropylmalate/(R)-2-methylmalate dehydratase small subunit
MTLPDGRAVKFPIDSFSKYCLLNGVDQLGFLQGLDGQIAEYEGENVARVNTVG